MKLMLVALAAFACTAIAHDAAAQQNPMRPGRWEVTAQMDMPGREIRPGVWIGLNSAIDWESVEIVGPAYIGSSVRIEPGAKVIGPTWIGHGSHLRANSNVVRSVLFEYTRIGEGMTFEDMVVSPQFYVDRNGATGYVGDDRCALRWGDARA